MNEKKHEMTINYWDIHSPLENKSITYSISFRIRLWLMAFRLPTLSASIIPVSVGSALAASEGCFSWSCFLVALFSSVLIQIGTNLANDYYDFLGGIDSRILLDPRRVKLLNTGMLKARHFYLAFRLALALAFFVGLYLVAVRGMVILLIGLISILTGLAYSTGPWPLAKKGLGDLFVFLFFGPVAVVGSFYLQTGLISAKALLSSLPVGFLATAILVIDNLRDIEIDRQSGKHTLAVRIGSFWSRLEYVGLLLISYSVLFLMGSVTSPRVWLPLSTLAWSARLILKVGLNEPDKQTCARLMNNTAALHFIFGLLLTLGFIL
jgi:1,4-dihydroxy-2-naphthoate octaprenyltransferase